MKSLIIYKHKIDINLHFYISMKTCTLYKMIEVQKVDVPERRKSVESIEVTHYKKYILKNTFFFSLYQSKSIDFNIFFICIT